MCFASLLLTIWHSYRSYNLFRWLILDFYIVRPALWDVEVSSNYVVSKYLLLGLVHLFFLHCSKIFRNLWVIFYSHKKIISEKWVFNAKKLENNLTKRLEIYWPNKCEVFSSTRLKNSVVLTQQILVCILKYPTLVVGCWSLNHVIYLKLKQK